MVAHGRHPRLLPIAIAVAVVAIGALALARTTRAVGPAHAATGPAHAATGPARAATGPARAASGPARAATRPARAAAGHGIPKPPPAVAAARRRRARANAEKLISRLSLPAGAVELAHEPSGDGGALAQPFSRPVTPTLVDEHAWWRVPGSAASALVYVKAHSPRGGKLTLSGWDGPIHGPPASVFVGFSWPAVARLLLNRQLLVQAVDLPGGVAGVRVDAQVQWIIPRPVSERIPRGVHEIDVTRAVPGESPSLSVKMVAPKQVRALVSMVDALEIVQPGATSCPAILAGAPVVTFTFRASDGGTVLASASELASAREPTTTPCDPMAFSVRGHPQTPLLGGAAVVHAAAGLLGVHLQTPPSQQPGSATG